MTSPLLSTKLFTPSPRAKLVSRPRLENRLNAGLQKQLTLISAPAGLGKYHDHCNKPAIRKTNPILELVDYFPGWWFRRAGFYTMDNDQLRINILLAKSVYERQSCI